MADSENSKPFYNSAIPSDWEVKKLGNLGKVISGLTYSPEDVCGDTGVLVLRSSNVQGGQIVFVDNVFVTIKDGDFNPVKTNDILICVRNGSKSLIGKNALITEKAQGMAFGAFMAVFRSEFNNYLLHVFSTDLYKREIHRNLGATINSINGSDLKQFKVPLPPLAEQKANAHVLGLMDRAINQNNQLIVQKKLRKKWLMQNLLTGKKRLKGFSGEWELKQLGAVAHESSARNKSSMTSVSLMAVTKASGIVPMRERVQGDSVLRCKIIEKDSFAYNPMRLNIGSIARWTESSRAMVSGDYVVFRCDETQLDPNYLDFFRKTNIWTNFVDRAGDGSVRVRIYFSHLKHLKLKLPPLPEQTAIAQVLLAADKEIQLLKTKTEKLREQKKGMMQQLLTGKKRLKIEDYCSVI